MKADFHKLFDEVFKEMTLSERSDAFSYLFGVFGGHFKSHSSMSEKQVFEALKDALKEWKNHD